MKKTILLLMYLTMIGSISLMAVLKENQTRRDIPETSYGIDESTDELRLGSNDSTTILNVNDSSGLILVGIPDGTAVHALTPLFIETRTTAPITLDHFDV